MRLELECASCGNMGVLYGDQEGERKVLECTMYGSTSFTAYHVPNKHADQTRQDIELLKSKGLGRDFDDIIHRLKRNFEQSI